MKQVIIIGGGFAGAYAAKKLERDFAVTLIDTKDYFEFTPSILRTLVEPEHLPKIQVQHKHYLHKTKIICEEVDTITPQKVVFKSGSLDYDYLLLCSGSTYNAPIKEKNVVIANRAHELREYAAKLREADSVLIIGGGLVGVELAAEICTVYPRKKITIVHAQRELIERNPPKARQYAKKFLVQRGVNIIFNEKVISFHRHNFVTDKKRKLRADLAFVCTGIKPNYEYLQEHFSAEVGERGYVNSNSFLQMENYPCIFAAGDVTNIAEEKTAQNAEMQAKIMVKNIHHLEKDEPLESYQSKPRIMVISLGKWNGLLVFKNFFLSGVLPGILKRLIEWKTMRKYRE